MTSLFAAGFVLCALRPYLVESTGFLLTFLSTLGILLLAGPLSDLFAGLLPWRGRLWRGICSMTAVTVAATLATAPVLLLSFGELSTLALPANLLTYSPSWRSCCVPWRRCCCPCRPCFGRWRGWSSSAMRCSNGCAPFAEAFSTPIRRPCSSPMHTRSRVVCFAHRHDKQQHRRLALLCALVLIAGAIAAAPAQGDALVVAMIDVGQGMSVLVQDGGADVLVDCGSESVQDAPERIIRALQSRGVYSLDTLVLTHLHEDHISALETVIDSFSVGEIVFGAGSPMVQNTASVISLAAQKGIAMRTVKPQQRSDAQAGREHHDVFCAPSLSDR